MWAPPCEICSPSVTFLPFFNTLWFYVRSTFHTIQATSSLKIKYRPQSNNYRIFHSDLYFEVQLLCFFFFFIIILFSNLKYCILIVLICTQILLKGLLQHSIYVNPVCLTAGLTQQFLINPFLGDLNNGKIMNLVFFVLFFFLTSGNGFQCNYFTFSK